MARTKHTAAVTTGGAAGRAKARPQPAGISLSFPILTCTWYNLGISAYAAFCA